ncbi:MAG: hypothetical protein ACOCM2_04950, partial [Bacteroidales bacterium]
VNGQGILSPSCLPFHHPGFLFWRSRPADAKWKTMFSAAKLGKKRHYGKVSGAFVRYLLLKKAFFTAYRARIMDFLIT